jgi:hypothetical protein
VSAPFVATANLCFDALKNCCWVAREALSFEHPLPRLSRAEGPEQSCMIRCIKWTTALRDEGRYGMPVLDEPGTDPFGICNGAQYRAVDNRLPAHTDRNSLLIKPLPDDNDPPKDEPLAFSIFQIAGSAFRCVVREPWKGCKNVTDCAKAASKGSRIGSKVSKQPARLRAVRG